MDQAQPAKRSSGQRLGTVGYLNLLAALAARPMTAKEVADQTGTAVNATRAALRGMRRFGLVRVASWTTVFNHPTQVFGLGDEPDSPRPLNLDGSVSGRASQKAKPPGLELIAFCHMVRMLMDGPATSDELQEASGCNAETVRKLLTAARRLGLVHIAEWRRGFHGGLPSRCFAFKPGAQDARRPAPQTREAIERRSRQRRTERNRQLRMLTAIAGGRQRNQEARS